jgi:hypothetical protein
MGTDLGRVTNAGPLQVPRVQVLGDVRRCGCHERAARRGLDVGEV